MQHEHDGRAHWPQHAALKLGVVIASAFLQIYVLQQCPNPVAHAHFSPSGAQGMSDISYAAIPNFPFSLHFTFFFSQWKMESGIYLTES